MFNRKKVLIDSAFKRLIFDAIKSKEELKSGYSLSQLKEVKIREEAIFYLKENNYLEKDILIIPEEYLLIFEDIKKSYDSVPKDKLLQVKEKFTLLFNQCQKDFDENKTFDFYLEQKDELKNLATYIHFAELPEFDIDTIINREYIPEEFPDNFYDHYNTLEKLLFWINSSSEDKLNSRKTLGDLTLNKNLTLNIFSSKNNSYKKYNIERTIYGWNCHFFKTKYGGKNGEAILTTLNQDFIGYPITLQNIFAALWEKADSSYMTLEELQENLNKISSWISLSEKNIPNIV